MTHHDYSDGVASGSSPERPQPEMQMQMHTRRPSRRAVGIVSDAPPAGDVDVDVSVSVSGDAHIVINPAGMGVEDGIVALEPNDDFAMGAPPGAPGAFEGGGVDAGATPRAGVVGLPPVETTTTTRLVRATPVVLVPATATMVLGGATHAAHTRERGEREAAEMQTVPTGPYRDEDVLLSLQLLAYLSKYPHVRQAFYKQRERFHPASVDVPGSGTVGPSPIGVVAKGIKGKSVVMSARAKEKERAISTSSSSSSSAATVVALSPPTPTAAPRRQTNVFSLVERFTFKPSSTETDMLPKLPSEIQYWAGVIMRNACRKDDSRGGVRQCANSEFFFFFPMLMVWV